MCKLFGFIGEKDDNVVKIIRGLLLAEEKSNPHGTGIVTNRKGLFTIKKKGIRGLHFIAQGYADFLWRESFDYLIGHVRYKTAGDACDRNAHPFGSQVAEKWYFLAHNGVLGSEIDDVAKKFKANIDKVKVDSEKFLRCITAQMRNGTDIVEAIKNATYEVSDVGDFAFTLLTPRELYVWRNNERPLNIIYYKNSIFYASTLSMFKDALEISGVKMEKTVYSEVNPYTLYKIVKEKGKVKIYAVEENMPHKERKPKFKSHSLYSGYYSGYSNYNWDYTKKDKNKKKKVQLDEKWGKTYEGYGLFNLSISSNSNKTKEEDSIINSYKKWLSCSVDTAKAQVLEKAHKELTKVYFEYGHLIPEEDKIEIENKIYDIEREFAYRAASYIDDEDLKEEETHNEYEPF